MTDILFTANGASAIVQVNGELTSGMVGVPVRFAFDSDWDGLNIVVVFDGSGRRISVPLLTGYQGVLPWEVIAKANTRLHIGAEGRKSDGSIVIPTVWANAGYIREGAAATDDEGNPPTPSIYDQIMAAIEAGKLQGKPGEDGVSPTVSVTEIEGGHRVTITDANETQVFDVMDGKDGSDASVNIVDDLDTKDPNAALSANMGAVLREKVDTDLLGVQKELQAEIKQRVKTVNGIAPDENGNVVVEVPEGGGGSGEPGADGFSPVATVTQTGSGAVISITDKSGTTTANVFNGKDGAQGIQGEQGPKGDTGAPGADGAKGDKGDKGDTGAQGEPGKDGADGAPGAAGKDGVSATHSWNGTTLTVTSASGTSSANLKGEKGDKGDTGGTGAAGTSVTVKSVSESTADGGSNVVTFSDGKTLTIKNGSKGSTGSNGTNGVSVSSVKQTTTSSADGGSNVVTVTLSNGTTSTFTVKNGSKGSTGATGPQGPAGKDGAADLSVEILLPSEIVAVVGVEFNMYYKSFIRSNRSLDNFEIKCSLSNTSVDYKLYNECFRLTAVDANVGSYTLTVQVKDIISGSVKAEKAVAFHIIKNRALNNKNVLYLGDSLTFSRGGLYPAEIQYNLSGGKLISIGSQIGSADSNGIGQVRHEGYNGATVGGFLSANVTSGNVNKFYNPSTGQFDLSYFMTNQGYTQLDAVCLNLGHNNLGNHVNAVSGLQTIISKIHEYNADIPVIISLIEPLAGQDGWTKKTKSTAIEMNRHWKNLISAYITAFDNGKISNVYLSAPYLNIDADNDFPTETVARSARDTTQIVRQNDAMHPGKIGTLKMADVYFANLLCRIPEDNAIYYSVTNKLTNVTTNNNVGSVKEGSSYTATLTPADGYVLDSVTVTMGGNPVTVTNGVINISGVTGDIVITATAKVYVPAYTNLAKPSTASSSPNTALTADEWLNGYYISSKKISAKADLIVTNKIPLTASDTIRIKGIADTGSINEQTCYSRFRILPCDASGSALVTEIQPALPTGQYIGQMDAAELEKGIYCFSPNNLEQKSYWANVAFVRICGYPIDGNNANVIVTVNQEITD